MERHAPACCGGHLTTQPPLVFSEASRALIADLNAALREPARGDALTRAIYATDASIYEVPPLAVVFPHDGAEVQAVLEVARCHGAPVLARGAGTSLAGQAVGAAVVMDFSRHMKRVLELDPESRRARVQPGVVLDSLNRAARPHGLVFGPDVAPSSRATLGGMIGNNSCGARSALFGKTVDHVLSLDALLADGERVHLTEASSGGLPTRAPGRLGELARGLEPIVNTHRETVRARFPQIPRRVSGYNLDQLVDAEHANLARLVVGSEGTLAVVTEAELSLVPLPGATGLGVLAFDGIPEAVDVVDEVLELGPSAVELIDRVLLEQALSHRAYRERAADLAGSAAALLVVEFQGDNRKQVSDRLEQLNRRLGRFGLLRLTEPVRQADLWAVRKAGLALVMGMRGDHKPVAFIEDCAVRPQQLGEYVRRLDRILDAHGVRAVYYGHASVGCLHIRPILDLKGPQGVQGLRQIGREVAALVQEFGGAMSGEHGDGRLRSLFLEQMFGPEIINAFREVKRAFDPEGLLNPGNLVEPADPTESLRYDRGYRRQEAAPAVLDWSVEGGFQRAVELCNGNGMCRKLDAGTMCPSYMATGDEEHTTRGRANALRAYLGGRLPTGPDSEQRVLEALELCVECKGCRLECPSGVDMTKIKFEFLARLRARGEAPFRDRLFAHAPAILQRSSPHGRLVNKLQNLWPVRLARQAALGIDARRRLPALAEETFKDWFAKRSVPVVAGGRQVLLLADTYTNYLEPQIGRAAVRVLEAAGFRVRLAPIDCCGRSLISKGFAIEARALMRHNLDILAPLVSDGTRLVGLEPSCLLTFRDESLSLCPGPEAELVASSSLLLGEFLLQDPAGRELLERSRLNARALFHGHCQHKALALNGSPADPLRRLGGLELEELDAGCCGMAGAFGYEREHYELSLAMGERVLLPAVRSAEPTTRVIADGFSCRCQIEHATGRQALHSAELLAEAVGEGSPNS